MLKKNIKYSSSLLSGGLVPWKRELSLLVCVVFLGSYEYVSSLE